MVLSANLLQYLAILILRAPLDDLTVLKLVIAFPVDDCVTEQGLQTL
ncbi:hypothetical protein T10_8089 [Trichinella papuae]|uniref:Uncharacterized protein n=1 Tax=Trichinella papuae TaxID=268474 RepID=A0A0V1LX86_9BILA|nr:hypothetical protein T10_8089 [Trichinella papuae]